MSRPLRPGIVRLRDLAGEEEDHRRRALGAARAATAAAETALAAAEAALAAAAAGIGPEFHEQYQRFGAAQGQRIAAARAALAEARAGEEQARTDLTAARQRTRAMEALVERDRTALALRQRRRLERDVQDLVTVAQSTP
jgi:flagellar export protein FliJ